MNRKHFIASLFCYALFSTNVRPAYADSTTTYGEAITRVLKEGNRLRELLDSHSSDLRIQVNDDKNIADKLSKIDLSGCPYDFKVAFINLTSAIEDRNEFYQFMYKKYGDGGIGLYLRAIPDMLLTNRDFDAEAREVPKQLAEYEHNVKSAERNVRKIMLKYIND